MVPQRGAAQGASNKIFVGNLPFSASVEDIARLFSEFGDVHSVNIRKDRETGKSRGFAFVTFKEDAAAQTAVGRGGMVMAGRQLTVGHALARGQEKASGGMSHGEGSNRVGAENSSRKQNKKKKKKKKNSGWGSGWAGPEA